MSAPLSTVSRVCPEPRPAASALNPVALIGVIYRRCSLHVTRPVRRTLAAGVQRERSRSRPEARWATARPFAHVVTLRARAGTPRTSRTRRSWREITIYPRRRPGSRATPTRGRRSEKRARCGAIRKPRSVGVTPGEVHRIHHHPCRLLGDLALVVVVERDPTPVRVPRVEGVACVVDGDRPVPVVREGIGMRRERVARVLAPCVARGSGHDAVEVRQRPREPAVDVKPHAADVLRRTIERGAPVGGSVTPGSRAAGEIAEPILAGPFTTAGAPMPVRKRRMLPTSTPAWRALGAPASTAHGCGSPKITPRPIGPEPE